MGFLASVFGGSKTSKQETTTNTSMVDNSTTLGNGATSIGPGASVSISDVSADVAIKALDTAENISAGTMQAVSDTAARAITENASVAKTGLALSGDVILKAIDAQEESAAATQRSAQESIFYANSLAARGADLMKTASTGGQTDQLVTVGKYAAISAGILAAAVVAYLVFKRGK